MIFVRKSWPMSILIHYFNFDVYDCTQIDNKNQIMKIQSKHKLSSKYKTFHQKNLFCFINQLATQKDLRVSIYTIH